MSFNRFVKSIEESASIKALEKFKKLQSEGKDVIGLTVGEPDFDTPSLIVDAAIKELKGGNTHYSVGKGDLELRILISKKLKEDNHIFYDPDCIIVTPGAKTAIFATIMACINPGDEVMIPSPSWVSYFEMVKAIGGVPVEVDLSINENYSITKGILEKYFSNKTKMLIINSPNNPTGHVLSKKEVAEIKDFVKDKEIFLISDEIYEKIIFDSVVNFSLASDKELYNKTITINGFSKTYAMTGWRIGYLAGPKPIVSIINKLCSHLFTGVSPFIQKACCLAFNCNDEVERMKKEYEERKTAFINELADCPNISIYNPSGTFYVWIKGKGMCSFADLLFEHTGVLGVSGTTYGKAFDDCVRFSMTKDQSTLIEAAKRIKAFLLMKNN